LTYIYLLKLQYNHRLILLNFFPTSIMLVQKVLNVVEESRLLSAGE